MKITRKAKMSKIISTNPEATEILFEAGLNCIGCPMAMQETLEEACKVHRMRNKEIDKLVNKLNKNSRS